MKGFLPGSPRRSWRGCWWGRGCTRWSHRSSPRPYVDKQEWHCTQKCTVWRRLKWEGVASNSLVLDLDVPQQTHVGIEGEGVLGIQEKYFLPITGILSSLSLSPLGRRPSCSPSTWTWSPPSRPRRRLPQRQTAPTPAGGSPGFGSTCCWTQALPANVISLKKYPPTILFALPLYPDFPGPRVPRVAPLHAPDGVGPQQRRWLGGIEAELFREKIHDLSQ